MNRVGHAPLYNPKSTYQGMGKTGDQPIEHKEIVPAPPATPTNGFTPDQPIDRFCADGIGSSNARKVTSDQPIPRR